MPQYPPISGTVLRPKSAAFFSSSTSSTPASSSKDIDHEDIIRVLSSPSAPRPVVGGKNIFAFWHSGLETVPPYLLRNIIAWHRRFAGRHGWSVYVLDNVEGSPRNVKNFIDTASPSVVPETYTLGQLQGEYAAQHTSDLIRYPLLLKYGGAYLDVGVLHFGDLEWLWTTHVSNPDSPVDFAGFSLGDSLPDSVTICNFALTCGPDNPLILRAHRILLGLWRGRMNTTGMHKHPLVDHVELMHVPQEVTVDVVGGQEKMVINDEVMTDYAIQIQAMGCAQRWRDTEDGWDGPKYVEEKCWLYSMLSSAMQFEQLANWSGQRSFDLLSLKVADDVDDESDDQKLARRIVEETVSKGWILKLGHGFSAKLFGGDTLGMLWRKHPGSDCAEGTYAGWLRWAEWNLQQEQPPSPLSIPEYEATKVASMKDYLSS